MKTLGRIVLMASAGTALLALAASSTQAQVVYAPDANPYVFPYSDPSPHDQAFGTRPSYEFSTDPYYRGPAVRVVVRCNYPNGWNSTDFSRDLNGVPADVDHTCPVQLRQRVRARY